MRSILYNKDGFNTSFNGRKFCNNDVCIASDICSSRTLSIIRKQSVTTGNKLLYYNYANDKLRRPDEILLLENYDEIIVDLINKYNKLGINNSYLNRLVTLDSDKLISYDGLLQLVSTLNNNNGIIEILGNNLKIGDLVIFYKNHNFNYGIMISKSMILNEFFGKSRPKWVYLVKNLTVQEKELQKRLFDYYQKIFMNKLELKFSNNLEGSLFKYGSFYCLNLGKRVSEFRLKNKTNSKVNLFFDGLEDMWIMIKDLPEDLFVKLVLNDEKVLLDTLDKSIQSGSYTNPHQVEIEPGILATYYTIDGIRSIKNVKIDKNYELVAMLKLPQVLDLNLGNYQMLLKRVGD